MIKKKQSSLDFFTKKLAKKGLLITEDSEYIVAYLEAKQMEKEIQKEQIKNAQMDMFLHLNNLPYGSDYYNKMQEAEDFADKYYNETLGSSTGVIGVDNISWTNTNKFNNGGNNETH